MLKKLLIFFIGLYQKIVSPYLGARCRFYPSCSEYAKESLQTLPILEALFRITWRLLRCGPWSKGGVDFVKIHQSKKEELL